MYKLKVLLAISIVCWIIISLLFIIRNSYNIDQDVTIYQTTIVAGLMIMHGLAYLEIMKKIIKYNKCGVVRKVINLIIDKVYTTPLSILTQLIIEDYYYSKLIVILKSLCLILFNEKYTRVFLTLYFLLIPRFIVSIALWIDVYFLHKIYVFYHFIWYFIIPIIVSSIIEIIKQHSIMTLRELEDNKIVLEFINNIYAISSFKYNATIGEKHSIVSLCTHNLQVLTLIQNIQHIKDSYFFLYLQAFISVSFIIGWEWCFLLILSSKNIIAL